MVRNFIIHGIVFPERVDINVYNLKMAIVDQIGSANIDLSIIRSKLICHYTSEFHREIYDIRNPILRVSNDVVNYVGFLNNYGMSVFIESIFNIESKETVVFGAEGYAYSEQSKVIQNADFIPNTAIENNINLANLTDPYFCRALQEIRNSIAYPDFTALHSKLAVDAIQNAFQGNDPERWEALRQNLKLTKTRLNMFKAIADDQRHGRNRPQSWEERRDAMQIASEVVHRYSLWKLNGMTPISLPEF